MEDPLLNEAKLETPHRTKLTFKVLLQLWLWILFATVFLGVLLGLGVGYVQDDQWQYVKWQLILAAPNSIVLTVFFLVQEWVLNKILGSH